VEFSAGADSLTGTTLGVANIDVTGATVTLSGATAVPGVTVVSGRLLVGAAGATLTGAGVVVLTDSVDTQITGAAAPSVLTNDTHLEGAGQLGGGGMELVNGSAGAIETLAGGFTINTGTNTIANAGVIETAGSGALTISSPIDNTGKLIAYSASTLKATGAVTGSGFVEVMSGTLDLASSFNENVTFLGGATGVLELGDSKGYATGAITGLSLTGANALDLLDIPFVSGATTATYTGTATSGVLTVKDGANVAAIHLTGDYIASSFTLSAGPGGVGTKIVDPPSTESSRTVTHGFIAAMASFGATPAAETGGAVSIAPAAGSLLARPAPHQAA